MPISREQVAKQAEKDLKEAASRLRVLILEGRTFEYIKSDPSFQGLLSGVDAAVRQLNEVSKHQYIPF